MNELPFLASIFWSTDFFCKLGALEIFHDLQLIFAEEWRWSFVKNIAVYIKYFRSSQEKVFVGLTVLPRLERPLN